MSTSGDTYGVPISATLVAAVQRRVIGAPFAQSVTPRGPTVDPSIGSFRQWDGEARPPDSSPAPNPSRDRA